MKRNLPSVAFPKDKFMQDLPDVLTKIVKQLTRIADAIGDTVAIVDPKPAPDALVEAVKKAAGQIDNLLLLHNPTQADLRMGIRDCWETLESGLNTHEKAVR